MKVLVLGGTGEGRALAAELVRRGIPVISSLAGRVSSPRLPEGEVRIGGFGGAAGLAEFISTERISAVVDATHPFAARITANAAAACRLATQDALSTQGASSTENALSTREPRNAGEAPETRGPRRGAENPRPSQTSSSTVFFVLRRPEWVASDEDRWTRVADIASAAGRIAQTPSTTRVLLTTGRQETAAFAPLPQRFWLRAVERPDGPLPEHCETILDRGPFTLDGERELLRDKRIDVLVSKNSGGPMTAAKLTAARERGIEVVMVERPPIPAGVATVATVDEATQWLLTSLS